MAGESAYLTAIISSASMEGLSVKVTLMMPQDRGTASAFTLLALFQMPVSPPYLQDKVSRAAPTGWTIELMDVSLGSDAPRTFNYRVSCGRCVKG